MAKRNDNDIAVFKVPDKQYENGFKLTQFPYSIGKSSELEYDDLVYLVGNPFMIGTNIRQGHISMKDYISKGFYNKSEIISSLPVSPGDSGGPVLAVRDYSFELVGLQKSVLQKNNNISMFIGIDTIIESIKTNSLDQLAEDLNSRQYQNF